MSKLAPSAAVSGASRCASRQIRLTGFQQVALSHVPNDHCVGSSESIYLISQYLLSNYRLFYMLECLTLAMNVTVECGHVIVRIGQPTDPHWWLSLQIFTLVSTTRLQSQHRPAMVWTRMHAKGQDPAPGVRAQQWGMPAIPRYAPFMSCSAVYSVIDAHEWNLLLEHWSQCMAPSFATNVERQRCHGPHSLPSVQLGRDDTDCIALSVSLWLQADAKRLPPAIFNCTTNAAAAGQVASASIAAPPTEVSQGGQDAPSLLDAGAISTEGSQNGVKEFSFASKVSNSVSSGSADLAAP